MYADLTYAQGLADDILANQTPHGINRSADFAEAAMRKYPKSKMLAPMCGRIINDWIDYVLGGC